MNNRVVESIMLFGDDSIRFANSLINPSKESVNTHLNIMNLINQNIELCVDNNGFDVEINDLDLSFINDPNAVNELSVGLLPDSQFSESQMKKIKKDGTVSNAISYELSDTETPVDLTCKNGMFGEEIGTITYDVK